MDASRKHALTFAKLKDPRFFLCAGILAHPKFLQFQSILLVFLQGLLPGTGSGVVFDAACPL